MNSMLNKIINSNKLYTITIVLSVVVCVFLSVSVESRPSVASKLDRNQTNETQEPAFEQPQLKADPGGQAAVNSTAVDESSHKAAASNSTNAGRITPRTQHGYFTLQSYDPAFFFRLFVFISAFCLVIFASIFVKSLNSRTVMYGYLDTKCGDEERLMSKGHASDYWEEDEEVVMFDAIDFKKEHYKD